MKRRPAAWLGLGFAILMVAASCSDDESSATSGSTGSVNPTGGGSGCQQYVDAVCSKLTSCGSGGEALVGDYDYCRERFATVCDSFMALDGVSATSEEFVTCATALEQSSCDEFFPTIFDNCEGVTAGTKPDGAPCSSGAQCAGGACDKDAGEDCGVCAVELQLGDPCMGSLDCRLGLWCGNDMTCQEFVRGGEGATCDASQGLACNGGLYCDNNVCTARGGQGASCTNSLACDTGFFCDQNSNTCAPNPPLAMPGEPCGVMNNVYIQCEVTAYCDNDVCVERVADGGSCTDSDQCLLAAKCIDGSCQLGSVTCN